jgi:hypothetical protein
MLKIDYEYWVEITEIQSNDSYDCLSKEEKIEFFREFQDSDEDEDEIDEDEQREIYWRNYYRPKVTDYDEGSILEICEEYAPNWMFHKILLDTTTEQLKSYIEENELFDDFITMDRDSLIQNILKSLHKEIKKK